MNWSDLESTIAKVAPVLGSAIGGPAGGLIGSLISSKLGTDSNPDAVAAALAADPQNLLKLKEIEQEQQSSLQDFLQKEDQGQMDVDKQEAASTSLFVAGWRPAVGWSCAAAFVYSFVVQPFAVFVIACAGLKVVPPTLDLSTMMPVLLGMLGLAGMRTYEKVQGASTDSQAN